MPRIESKPKTTMFEGKEVTVETIDCTPTWSGLLNMLLEIHSNGTTKESRQTALQELQKMARVADEHVEEMKELDTRIICITWSVDDVHTLNEKMQNRDITDEEAMDILRNVEKNHDREHGGITLEVIANQIELWYTLNPILPSEEEIQELEEEIFQALKSIYTNKDNEDQYGQVHVRYYAMWIMKRILSPKAIWWLQYGKCKYGTFTLYGGSLGEYHAVTVTSEFYQAVRRG